MRPTAVLALGLTLGFAAPAAAQQVDDLAGLLDTLAVLWRHGEAAELAAHSAATGIDLEVQGRLIGSLHGRRAAAALRQLLGGQETVSVRSGSAAKVVGVDDRAFGEFIWVVRMPGADVTETLKIFVALIREEQGWRISEIRIFR